MKNYLKVYLFCAITLFTIASCAVNDQEGVNEIEEQLSPIEPTVLIPHPTPCPGFDLFTEPFYDCGYKTGIDDYVAHYNEIVEMLGIDECSKIRVSFDNSSSGKVATVKASYVSNHSQIAPLVHSNFALYRSLLAPYEGDSTNLRKMGQFDGYHAIRGQQPFASANDDCSNKKQQIK